MKNVAFPTTIIDGFFDDPDAVREFALKQEFKDSENDGYIWPGKRSKLLHEICPNFFQTFVNKMLSAFYDLNSTEYKWEATACFQIVNKEYQYGWVHKDKDVFTGIVYLSKNYENSGTTLYEAKNPIEAAIKHHDKKQESFRDLTALENNRVYREENNNQFIPSITVEGKYNRLVLFDSHLYHSANNFSDDRLTLIVFVKNIFILNSLHPIQRVNRLTSHQI